MHDDAHGNSEAGSRVHVVRSTTNGKPPGDDAWELRSAAARDNTFVRPTPSSSVLEKPVTDLPFTRYSPSTLTFAKPAYRRVSIRWAADDRT